jgi:hypothetical protein
LLFKKVGSMTSEFEMDKESIPVNLELVKVFEINDVLNTVGRPVKHQESKPIEFVPPTEGTPAAQALAGFFGAV